MADVAISNLTTELTTPADGDLLAIDDISAGETKKIQAANLLAAKAPIASPTFTGTVTLPADPTTSLGAATKAYVDAVASGLDIKESCRVATPRPCLLTPRQGPASEKHLR